MCWNGLVPERRRSGWQGGIFKQLLAYFNIYIYSEVISIGDVNYPGYKLEAGKLEEFISKVEASRCVAGVCR